MARFSGVMGRLVVGAVFVALLAGCVTTTDSRFAREADRDKAIRSYIELATAYLGQGNVERARVHLDRALELDNDSAEANAVLGLIQQSQGDMGLADASFQRALKSKPDYTRGRVFYGAFLFGQDRFTDAKVQFQRASQDSGYPERASVYFNLGMTEERLGNIEAAESAYLRSVDLSRGEVQSLLALSRVLVEQDEFEEAARYYSRLTSVMQRNPNMRHSPESLLTGIRIARHYNDRDRESSLALLLRNEYPESEEYKRYKVLISDVQ
ncbi:type IV pilus biogenesis/stability protein PilW [Marinobacter zhejiangensis]|uniref:Type IV pilus assembly protein PilF n=1 Tax=Marinobacter zhejiangensis TaxID=488535 RepID=A0A1I4P977_9GAMM|nr:type IV pilus assembly protein PilF [Marinobacter zhejiangensis]